MTIVIKKHDFNQKIFLTFNNDGRKIERIKKDKNVSIKHSSIYQELYLIE